jgi:hypothetical protein
MDRRVVREHLSWFVGGYALVALYLFFRARYWESEQLLKPFFIASTIFGTWFFGGLWISMGFLGIHHSSGSTLAGLGYALLTIALGITIWVLVPLWSSAQGKKRAKAKRM